ncbi:MAG TPA: YhjD/YihY/BrkB family envelope integrity protein [Steroidobacteraceae bacterium]|nr:YhjD/YihY/BrkB family envelope integrity protein [Steroidobacteraceae bacterium]
MSTLERLQEELFHKSRSMPRPWGPVLRILRYPAAIAREWLEGEISVRAMSLAYTTLLSLVPLMVFSFAILKGIGARTDLHFILQEFFRPLGSASEQVTQTVLTFVNNMRGGVLGSIGLVFLTYTVISTVQKVEAGFNFVWRVHRQRTLTRRFTEYLSVMIIGPILLALALGLLGSALHSPAARWLDSITPLAWVITALARLLPYVIVTVVFTFMYVFVPNTRVELRAALIGGVTAGVVWALVGQIFTAVLLYSSRMMVVYTGIAIVLATLIWVYLSWLILLLGAELAFYVQFPQYLPHGRETLTLDGRARERIGLSVMYLVARDYRRGSIRWNAARLAAELDVPGVALSPVLAILEQTGMLVATEKESFLPGRDPHAILICAIIEALRAPPPGRSTLTGRPLDPACALVAQIDTALRRDLGGHTLDDLIGAD